MRPVMVAADWAFLVLAVMLAVFGIAHDAAYIFAKRKMTRIRVLLISPLTLFTFIFIIISFRV